MDKLVSGAQILTRISEMEVRFVQSVSDLAGTVKLLDERTEKLQVKMEKLLGNGENGFLDNLQKELEGQITAVDKRVASQITAVEKKVSGVLSFRGKLLIIWSVLSTEAVVAYYLFSLYIKIKQH